VRQSLLRVLALHVREVESKVLQTGGRAEDRDCIQSQHARILLGQLEVPRPDERFLGRDVSIVIVRLWVPASQ
jgi:hypothetical protein